MDTKLNGRVALVTGATRDVGRQIALTLGAEGAAMAVHYHSSGEAADKVVAEIRAAGGTAIACKADIADRAAVQQMVDGVVAKLGGLNIVVNNAGLAIRRPFKETTPDEWRRQIDVNLMGAIHLCHAAAVHLEIAAGRLPAFVDAHLKLAEAYEHLGRAEDAKKERGKAK